MLIAVSIHNFYSYYTNSIIIPIFCNKKISIQAVIISATQSCDAGCLIIIYILIYLMYFLALFDFFDVVITYFLRVKRA